MAAFRRLLTAGLMLAAGSVSVYAGDPDLANVARQPIPPPVVVTPTVSRIAHESFYGQDMQAQRSFTVYLPPSYDQAPDRSYPVLYLLHADGGSPDTWLSLGLQQKMDQAIAAGLPEMIVVMPDQAEDRLLELVSAFDLSYRTIPDPSERFIGGLSSGGFSALNLALRHPDMFGTAMSFSGRDGTSRALAQPAIGNNLYVVLSTGFDDAVGRTQMKQVSDQLDKLGLQHEIHVVAGANDATAWNAGLDFGLMRLGLQLQTPPPGSLP